MPIYDLTYRGWRGARTRVPAWFPILEHTVKIAFRNKLLKAIYIAGTLPAFGTCIYLYFATQALVTTKRVMSPQQLLDLSRRIFDLQQYLFTLMIQGVLAMIVAALVGGSGLSSDRRGNAIETLFSRAISRNQYLAGRFLGLFSLVLFSTLVPGFCIWLSDLLFSPDEFRLQRTLTYPLRITFWAIEFSASASLLVLAFSAMIKRAWLGTAAFVAFLLITSAFADAVGAALRRSSVEATEFARGFSFFNAHLAIEGWILGVTKQQQNLHISTTSASIYLIALAALSVFVLFRKVRPIEVVS